MATLKTPDIAFSGMYYPDILEALLLHTRKNVVDITDEDPKEPYFQLLSAFAWILHSANTRSDLRANEDTIITVRTRAGLNALLTLIGRPLAQVTPASVDVVLRMSRPFTSIVNAVPVKSLFSTGVIEGQEVVFEALSDVVVNPSNVATCLVYDASSDAYSALTLGSPVWSTTPEAGDMLYIGHDGVQFDGVKLTLSVAGVGISGVWEYYDASYEDANPDVVEVDGGNITFELNAWLGSADRTGAQVRVRNSSTGGYEDLVVYFDSGVNKVTTIGLLGQGETPSEEPGDYIVGSLWQEVPDVADATSGLTVSGDELLLAYTHPQSTTEKWVSASIGEEGEKINGHWIRFRVVGVGAPTSPTIDAVDITAGTQYIVLRAVQGRSRIEDPLGSTSGEASQTMQLSGYPVLDDSSLRLFVNEGFGYSEYSRVSDFTNSGPDDRHFTVSFDDSGRATVNFGDGELGFVPPLGADNVYALYRTIADGVDGNVGANTVVVNRSGVSYFDGVKNPRPATGWKAAEGSTPESIERLRITGPATLRRINGGVTRDDIERMAVDEFIASDGSSPVARARAVEAGYGPKTVKLIVVGYNGSGLSQDYLDELGDFFNGTPSVGGKLLINHELTAVNFTPRPINVTATVYGGSRSAVIAALTSILSPIAVDDDGITWSWEFGENIPISLIVTTIMRTTPTPRNTTVSGSDAVLLDEELPTAGTFTLTMVE